MKLGIISQPEVQSFDHAKELGLDFVEFDCNPTAFFGRPVEELHAVKADLKAASERTGVEVGQPHPGREGPGYPGRVGGCQVCYRLRRISGRQVLPVLLRLCEGDFLLSKYHLRH